MLHMQPINSNTKKSCVSCFHFCAGILVLHKPSIMVSKGSLTDKLFSQLSLLALHIPEINTGRIKKNIAAIYCFLMEIF